MHSLTYKKRTLDPLSSLIDSGLCALNKAVERFVTSEMSQLLKLIKTKKQR